MGMNKLLILAGAAAVAIASEPAAPVAKRQLEECFNVATSLAPVLAAVPTPDSDLQSFIASQTQLATTASVTDLCEVPAVTGDMADEYTSYMSELSSWQVDNSEGLQSLLEVCSDVPEVNEQLSGLPSQITTVCSEWTWESGSPSNDGDGDGEDPATPNAAPRATGAAMAAVAMAGLFAAQF